MKSRPLRSLLLAIFAATLSLALPAAASALEFKIVNESGRPPGDVYVTVWGGGDESEFKVTGMVKNVSKTLEDIPGETLEIEELKAGRIYISYGAGVDQFDLPFASNTTRFDWVELNVSANPADKINLTAVEQVGIGMQIETFGPSSEPLESLRSANSDTIFAALQQIPGGPQATIRNAGGEILRVLSPQKVPAVIPGVSYPPLTEYMKSMAGKTITLRSHRGTTASRYAGAFAADGSIVLSGVTEPPGEAPATISVPAAELATDIYTGENTPDSLEGNIRRDLLVGFVTGLWDGKYGNDAGAFCTNALGSGLGPYCPTWWTQPVFGDARSGLEPFPTCDQYAAVLNQYSETFAHPYTERYARPEIPIVEVGSTPVASAKLTILADSGSAQPDTGGNADCGATQAAPSAGPAPKHPSTALHLRKKAKVMHGRVVKVGWVSCPSACGRVKSIAKHGKRVIARGKAKIAKPYGPLKLKLTKPGKRILHKKHKLKVAINVWVKSPGEKSVHRHGKLILIERR